MTIAVTGATGQLGRLVLKKLLERVSATEIIALARSQSKAANLGITVREAEYNQPEMLDRALVGVDTLLLISGNEVGQRVAQHRNVIEAAKKTGVRHIVYVSGLRTDTSALALATDHRATEVDLKASGVTYTILRNGWYTENTMAAIPAALATGALFGCAGSGQYASASREDYAEAAAVVLTDTGHEGKTYELAGDEPWTFSDLAAEITHQTGNTIIYKNLSREEYVNLLAKAGLANEIAEIIAGTQEAAAHGALFDDSHQLSKLIGRPTTPLAISVANVL